MCALSGRSDVGEPVSDSDVGRRLTADFPLCVALEAQTVPDEERKMQLDLTQEDI